MSLLSYLCVRPVLEHILPCVCQVSLHVKGRAKHGGDLGIGIGSMMPLVVYTMHCEQPAQAQKGLCRLRSCITSVSCCVLSGYLLSSTGNQGLLRTQARPPAAPVAQKRRLCFCMGPVHSALCLMRMQRATHGVPVRSTRSVLLLSHCPAVQCYFAHNIACREGGSARRAALSAAPAAHRRLGPKLQQLKHAGPCAGVGQKRDRACKRPLCGRLLICGCGAAYKQAGRLPGGRRPPGSKVCLAYSMKSFCGVGRSAERTSWKL